MWHPFPTERTKVGRCRSQLCHMWIIIKGPSRGLLKRQCTRTLVLWSKAKGKCFVIKAAVPQLKKNISNLRRQMVFVCIHWKEIRILKSQTIVICLFSAYNKRKNVELYSWLEKSVKTIYHCSQPPLFFKWVKISEAFTPRFALEPGVWSRSTL